MPKEGFIRIVGNHYEELRELNKLDNCYDYEKELMVYAGQLDC